MPRFPDRRGGRVVVAAAFLVLAAGCGQRPTLVPLSGRVTLAGKPLEFGSVMIQPTAGPAARATIQSDGSFAAGTFEPGDGAISGPAAVRVACYEQQRPGATPPAGEPSLGKSLIPERYTRFETSGITVAVAPGMPPLEIELSAETGP